MRVVIRIRRGAPLAFMTFAVLAGSLGAAAWIVHVRGPGADVPRDKPADPLAAIRVDESDLVLEEAVVGGEGEHRKVTGVLRNRSNRTYEDVNLTFSLIHGRNPVGMAFATVARVSSRGTVPFASNEFAHEHVRAILLGMTTGNR
jgi:hypothetical protein